MTLRIILLFILTNQVLLSFGQIGPKKMFQKVLARNIIDSSFSFDNSTKKDGFREITLAYLGTVKTDKGRLFKIVTYKFIWGPNRHTSGSIYIFNEKDQYVGRYALGGADDLPQQLKNDSLLFTNDHKKSCDRNLNTIINLRKGLPEKIFIRCKGNYGDLYGFSSD